MIKYKYILVGTCPKCLDIVEWGVYSTAPSLDNGKHHVDFIGCVQGCALGEEEEDRSKEAATRYEPEEYYGIE